MFQEENSHYPTVASDVAQQKGDQTLPDMIAYPPSPPPPPSYPPQPPDRNRMLGCILVVAILIVLVIAGSGYSLAHIINNGKNLSPTSRGATYCDALRDHHFDIAIRNSLTNTDLTSDQLASGIENLGSGWITGCRAYGESVQGDSATLAIDYYFPNGRRVIHHYTLFHTGPDNLWNGINTWRISTSTLTNGF